MYGFNDQLNGIPATRLIAVRQGSSRYSAGMRQNRTSVLVRLALQASLDHRDVLRSMERAVEQSRATFGEDALHGLGRQPRDQTVDVLGCGDDQGRSPARVDDPPARDRGR